MSYKILVYYGKKYGNNPEDFTLLDVSSSELERTLGRLRVENPDATVKPKPMEDLDKIDL